MTKKTAAIIATLTVAIARVTDKQGQFLGYIAQPSEPRNADGSVKAWYQVTWNATETRWVCNCPATKPCKHIAAVEASCAERKAAGRTPCDEGQEAAKPEAKPATAPARRTARMATESTATAQAMPPTNAAMASVFARPPHSATSASSVLDKVFTDIDDKIAFDNKVVAARAAELSQDNRRSQAPLGGGRAFSLLRR